MATAVQGQPLPHLECRARFARAAEAAQSVWSRPPEAAMKDGGVAPEALQDKKDNGLGVGHRPFSQNQPHPSFTPRLLASVQRTERTSATLQQSRL